MEKPPVKHTKTVYNILKGNQHDPSLPILICSCVNPEAAGEVVRVLLSADPDIQTDFIIRPQWIWE